MLLCADIILVLHASLAGFVVLFPFYVIASYRRRWPLSRNVSIRLVHLGVLLIIVTQSWLSIPCPLTTWEMALRAQAGAATYRETFIAHWVGRALFYHADEDVFVGIYTAFAALVGIMWWWFPVRMEITKNRT